MLSQKRQRGEIEKQKISCIMVKNPVHTLGTQREDGIFMKLKRIEAALLCAVLVASLCSVTSFASSCAQIRESVLRLHVLANSDSDADQALKLQVRDAVLEEGAHVFDGSLTAGEAEQAIEQALPQLERAARSEVMKRGYTYEVHITVSEEYFDTRTYEDEVTLPAGRYRAVRVIIGSGEGHNWWCVMFPPMCLPAAQGGVDLDGVLDGKEEKIVRSSPKYEPRFKIVEWIERLREYLREGSEEDGLETDYFTVTKVDQESTTESKTKPLSIWQGLFPLLWDGQADGREGRLAI